MTSISVSQLAMQLEHGAAFRLIDVRRAQALTSSGAKTRWWTVFWSCAAN